MPVDWLEETPKRRGIDWVESDAQVEDAAPARTNAERVQMGLVSMGKGLADVAGSPVDIANLLSSGFNFVGNKVGEMMAPMVDGTYEPQVTRAFPGGSEDIQSVASSIAQGAGYDPITDDEMTWKERILDDIVRFGTGGLVSGAGMSAAARNVPRTMGSYAPKFVENLTRPYTGNSARVIAGDVAGGIGAGAGVGTYEEVVPEEQQGPIGALLSALAGGGSGVALKSILEGATTGSGRMVKDAITGTDETAIPRDPLTGDVVRRNETVQAARRMQELASNPATAAANLRDATAELDQFASRGEQPTSGLLSDDVGLTILDNTQRAREPRAFIERDRAVNTRAANMLHEAAPAGADGRDFTDFVDNTVQRRLADIDNTLSTEQQALKRARPENPVSRYAGGGADASRRIDTRFRDTLGQERAQKNQLYNDPVLTASAVDPRPIYDAAIELERSLGVTGDRASLPNNIIANIRRLEDIDPETGEVVGLKDMTYGDVQDLRAQVSQAMSEATSASGRGASGSGPRVQNLQRLRNVLDGYIEELAGGEGGPSDKARAALSNYKDNYAPRFKSGQAGALARDIASDQTGVRTRPEDTASRFLGRNKGDDVESLRRAVPGAETEADMRAFVMSKLADTNIFDEKTGSLRPDTLRRFVNDNREVLKRVPGLSQEMNDLLAKARDGQRLTGELANQMRAAKTKADTARREVTSGPMGIASRKSPSNAVAAVFTSGDPERNMAALVAETAQDEGARQGLKAAIIDYLAEADTTTALEKTTDGSRPVSFAKLENTFNKHADTLSAVYSPEEMNALRRLHTLLRPQNNRALRGTVGSNTNESMQQIARLTEGGLKAYFGVLKGGGIMRSIRLFAESLPNNQKNVDRLLQRAMLDPDVAIHLLERPLADVGTPEWNSKLNRLLGYAAAGREISDDE